MGEKGGHKERRTWSMSRPTFLKSECTSFQYYKQFVYKKDKCSLKFTDRHKVKHFLSLLLHWLDCIRPLSIFSRVLHVDITSRSDRFRLTWHLPYDITWYWFNYVIIYHTHPKDIISITVETNLPWVIVGTLKIHV